MSDTTSMMQANLIPLARQEARVRRSRLRRWFSFCTGYCVLLVAAYGLAQGLWGTTDQVLERDVVEVSDDISTAKQEVGKVQPRLHEAKLTLAASKAVGSQPDWSALLALLASELKDQPALAFPSLNLAGAQLEAGSLWTHPDYSPVLRGVVAAQLHNIVLSSCELEPIRDLPAAGTPGAPGAAAATPGSAAGASQPRYLLIVRGLGRTPGTVSQYVLRMEQTRLFERVTLIESKRTPSGDRDVVSFRMECVLGR